MAKFSGHEFSAPPPPTIFFFSMYGIHNFKRKIPGFSKTMGTLIYKDLKEKLWAMLYDITLMKGPPQSTLMHIHMERGRVSNVSRMEKSTRIQPHKPMSLSPFSKAVRQSKCAYAIMHKPFLYYYTIKNIKKTDKNAH